jgi:molybdopterin/thiamine biosynthesis adenylyltransferase
MEKLKLWIRGATRSGQDFQIIRQDDLSDWAHSRNLTLRQALAEVLRAGVFPECYGRNFPSLSCLDQLRLFESRVLVAGLGGLGGVLVELLARVGVGRFFLADGDVFVPSNLNSQWLATQGTLGAHKAHVAARHLHDINPALLAEAIPAY